jgi:predicted nucleotidyltransferase
MKETWKRRGLFMKMKLLDLREKLPANLIEMLRAVSSVSQELGISYFVIGATARDLILNCGYDIEVRRATRDVDIGVAVRSWSEYEQLRKALTDSGKFINTNIEQRLIWVENRITLDLVPFGEIESPKGFVAFPPDGAFIMTTHGFTEAQKNTIVVLLDEALTIRVVSLAGLGLLKLVSWSDRPFERERDVQDLWFIIKNYLDAGNEERLFQPESREYIDLVENFDFELTGARLFGRDIAKLLNENTKLILQAALSEENENTGIYKLTAIISRFSNRLEPDDEKIISIWRAFRNELFDSFT